MVHAERRGSWQRRRPGLDADEMDLEVGHLGQQRQEMVQIGQPAAGRAWTGGWTRMRELAGRSGRGGGIHGIDG